MKQFYFISKINDNKINCLEESMYMLEVQSTMNENQVRIKVIWKLIIVRTSLNY
jgi:hypothetical protein